MKLHLLYRYHHPSKFTKTSYISTTSPIEIILEKVMFKVARTEGVYSMSLISIVAREDFISVVTDETEDSDTAVEYIKFKEVIPDTAFVAFSGDEEYAKLAVATAENLVLQGLCLKEIAEEIQASFSSGILSFDQSGRDFTAEIGRAHV